MSKQNTRKTTITQALKKAMASSGQSDYAIAKATGVPQPVVTRFRNGTRDTIQLNTADKLALFLGHSLVPDKD